MHSQLHGKTIVITGASSGIGLSTAFDFARASPRSLKLVLIARRLSKLNEIVEEIAREVGSGVKILALEIDLSIQSEVSNFVEILPEEFRDIDILVNNA